MVFAKTQTTVPPPPDLVEVGMFREKKVRKEILCWETYLFLCVYEQTIEN